ncbi:GntR family transcriptional regulator [Xylophilus sp.]|uniref:GntR family transcriptional regulator n=1 Tax=Xylophilus sp. TaxID=2653893 RepID=UPI0013BB09DE|nr:GntR family transcriptional regulator [Xylophilus sp.]KAF1050272.1 MAG: hypothetical protein GAK38_00298 [Xylophilus sp.]
MSGLDTQAFIPGQRLVEADLSAHFGVGRNSVREALQRLAAEGVVILLRHRGAVIRSLGLQDTLDVLDVAERMTGLLARSAARAGRSRDRNAQLRQAVKDLVAADRSQDASGFSRARRNFYRALLQLSGSQELRRLFPAIHMPIVHAQHRLPTLQKLRLDDYRHIARAVVSGDEEAADAAGSDHVRNVRAAILENAPPP